MHPTGVHSCFQKYFCWIKIADVNRVRGAITKITHAEYWVLTCVQTFCYGCCVDQVAFAQKTGDVNIDSLQTNLPFHDVTFVPHPSDSCLTQRLHLSHCHHHFYKFHQTAKCFLFCFASRSSLKPRVPSIFLDFTKKYRSLCCGSQAFWVHHRTHKSLIIPSVRLSTCG